MTMETLDSLDQLEAFVSRHNGPRESDIQTMLDELGYPSLDALMDAVIPDSIRLRAPLDLPSARTEYDVVSDLRTMALKNKVFRSYIGMGYSNTLTPPVILRNILENPGWYTAYTPYQAEISQGRLEALLNFQTVIADLTGLGCANASLLDEATAVAEAMHMTEAVTRKRGDLRFLIDENCHPQTIAVVETRARARGIRIEVGNPDDFTFDEVTLGAAVQYPGSDGRVRSYSDLCAAAHEANAMVTVAADLLSLTLLTPPGEWGADIVVGNSQRFGVPMGYGGPHAAFFSTHDRHKRSIPGRIIGVSQDAQGRPALRMALQTREQHIRRDKATSNICTAQVLLAVIAGMYAVYHGPEGLRRIARRVHGLTRALAQGLRQQGVTVVHDTFFDTVAIDLDQGRAAEVMVAAVAREINLRLITPARIGIALDERTSPEDVAELLELFGASASADSVVHLAESAAPAIPADLERTSAFLTHPVFHRYRSETEMLRYLKRLENKDLSLTAAMIPLGSCTLKLNATAEMIPITWREFGELHPFIPRDQAEGYTELFNLLETQLGEITGFDAMSLQPNAGSQGEFSGLLTILAYHESRGDTQRTSCLIPMSAHGTNPASAVMAGMTVVPVKSDPEGNIDVEDLRAKAEAHAETLGALMVTYPSTHGVFEASIRDICDIVHQYGGQVYLDGANMNAQVGLTRPGDMGADVCHLNLHKTFCIPHGGGGPGMGPIGVKTHLAPFLPTHPVVPMGGNQSQATIAAAPWGSASILPISLAYLALMGPDGLTKASQVAILNANYVAARLKEHFPLLYAGANGLVAHECILDVRPFKATAGIEVEDVAKRIIDYSFHPPTISFPVPGTMMVEPTESESKEELDRFCDALIAIREEIRDIENGTADREDNLLKHAPHTLEVVAANEWHHAYPRERAGFPIPAARASKLWPAVGRVDGAYGDRNLVCVCPPMEDYADA
ncbi:MAG: aminomethyl-transferring glycine dehydrogenase [Gemmatimonadales bacterium]